MRACVCTLTKPIHAQVRSGLHDEFVQGHTEIHAEGEAQVLIWRPLQPLLPNSRYVMTVNRSFGGVKAGVGWSGAELWLAKFGGEGEAARNPGFRHMDGEPVLGELSWDFFTTGYQPLRVAAVCRRVQRLAGGWLRVGCM